MPWIRSLISCTAMLSSAGAWAAPHEYHVEVTANPLEVDSAGTETRIYDKKEISSSGAENLGDFLARLPGFQAPSHSAGASGVSLRGLPDGNILVFWNGIRLNDPLHPGSAFDFSRLILSGVDSIRIVRGPEAGIWGSGASGAAIFISSSPPTEHTPDVEIGVDAASFGQLRSFARLGRSSGALSITGLLQGELSSGFSAASERDGNTESDGHEQQNAFLVLNYHASPTWQVKALVIAENARRDDDRSGGPGGDATNFESRAASLRTGFQLLRTPEESRLSQSLTMDASWDIRESERPPSQDRYRSRRIRAEKGLSFALSDDTRIEAHLGAENEKGLSREDDSTHDTEQTSIDLRSVFSKQGHRWRHKAGVSTQALSSTRGPLPWAFFVAPSYLIESTRTLVAPSLGHSFKNPSLYQLHSPYGDTALRPERSWTAELSLLQDLSGIFSDLELTFFWTRSTQTLDFDLNRFRYRNFGKRTSDGVEARLDTRLSPRLTLQSEHVWTRSPVLRVPEHKSSLGLTWEASARSRLSTTLLRVGSRPDVDAQDFAPKTQVPHILWNLRLSRRFWTNFEGYLSVDNLLDQDYEEIDGYGTPGRYFETGFRVTL